MEHLAERPLRCALTQPSKNIVHIPCQNGKPSYKEQGCLCTRLAMLWRQARRCDDLTDENRLPSMLCRYKNDPSGRRQLCRLSLLAKASLQMPSFLLRRKMPLGAIKLNYCAERYCKTNT